MRGYWGFLEETPKGTKGLSLGEVTSCERRRIAPEKMNQVHQFMLAQ
jgi:hypothetical protein